MDYFVYKAFGLIVSSEFEIPEFLPGKGVPDVYVKNAFVPSELASPHFSGVRFQASPDQFLLKVNGIADYLVENGCSVKVQRKDGSFDSEVRLFLLGSAFGALLHQRGVLPMHGSSVTINGKAYIFSGISGAGKSTLAAGFVARGYGLLSDDISVVSMDNDQKPFVYAGYPEMKLWVDSMEKLGMHPEQYTRVRNKLNKRQVSVVQKFNAESLPLGGIYILNTRNSEGILLDTLKGVEKFNALKNNTYRLNFIKGLGNTESHFKHISAVAMNCRVQRITRSSKGFSLDELIDLIEKDIHGGNES